MRIEKHFLFNQNYRMRRLKVHVEFDTTMALSPQSSYSLAPSPIRRLSTEEIRKSTSTNTTTSSVSLGKLPLRRYLRLDDTRKTPFPFETEIKS
mmetsp:Transcript_17188/g.39709  ORF Transcript_17188/g.39709 Transcript_17188/m.39709 type:complete len:94 (+) Transcript_17188:262-543(+)